MLGQLWGLLKVRVYMLAKGWVRVYMLAKGWVRVYVLAKGWVRVLLRVLTQAMGWVRGLTQAQGCWKGSQTAVMQTLHSTRHTSEFKTTRTATQAADCTTQGQAC